MHLIKALPKIRDAIIDSGDGSSLLKLNQMISEMKHKPNLHAEVFQKIFATTANFKSEADLKRIAQMANVDVDANRKSGNLHMESLDKREEFERQQRKRIREEREAKVQKRKRKVVAPSSSITGSNPVLTKTLPSPDE